MNKKDFRHQIIVESYGVANSIRVNSAAGVRAIRDVLRRYLPGCSFEKTTTPITHEFVYSWNASKLDSLYKDGERLSVRCKRDDLLESLGSAVRIAVAEFAIDRVFIHAGVVGWKGKAIIIPARSFKGKTALTAELVRRGARYYSDEYAVLDEKGRVHPFPKELSIRGIKNDYEQVDLAVETLGGRAGKKPLLVGLVLVTEYKKNARWKPKVINAGQGVMEMINNAVPIRYNPKFVLPVLNRVAGTAIFVKSKRGEAEDTAPVILDFFEANIR